MIKRNGSYPTDNIEKMRGGDGAATIEHLLTPDELYGKGRLFAAITLAPGSSIGAHVHDGEMEAFHVLSGVAEYGDATEAATLMPGDTTLTLSGEAHTVRSVGDAPLKLLALILYK